MDAFDVQKVAYRWMRRTIGLLGMALPITLAGVCHESGDCRPATSISGYYHTDMRFLFVTILVLLAVLLFAYPGYDEDDDFAGHLAGAFTMGVVIFPINAGGTPMGPSAWAHVICAAAMFLLLAVFCLFLFRRTEADRKPHGRAPSALAGARGFLKPPTKAPQPGSRKHARNTLFLICGIVIVGCVIGLLVSFVETRRGGHTSDLVWWCETIALFAFGLAWIVKGDMIMADEPAPASPVTGR